MRTYRWILIVPAVLASFVSADPLQAGQTRNAPSPGPAGTVTLPVAEYDRLVDRASQPVPDSERPPVPAVVARAELRARVEGNSVRGTLHVEGEVLQRGHVKVPLVRGATLLDARTDGRPLAMLRDGHTHSAVFTGPASFSAVLDWGASITAMPGRASLTLPQPASASLRAIVDLPGNPADVRVLSGLVRRRQSAAGRTIIELSLFPGAPAEISWSARELAPQVAVETRLLSAVRSLVTIGDGHVRMVSLVDITIVRGEPDSLRIHLPAGYELADVTGATLERTTANGSVLTLTLGTPARPRHQFLITLEQPDLPGSFKLATSFPAVDGTEREAGEAAIEGIGTMEVNAEGDGRLRRLDVRETHASLRSLARQPLLAAFRYHRRPNEARMLTLEVRRFADAPVLAAAAEHGTATTLVTAEGRALTEISLRLRNRARPFMKVTLPAGATMLSVEVEGEPARPVQGNGTRVPLLRPGLRPDGPYTVSFVYLHPGDAFGKRGEATLALAKLDLPINLLEWELFLPERYAARAVGGNVIPARVLYSSVKRSGDVTAPDTTPAPTPSESFLSFADTVTAGQIVGRVTDTTGASIPGATITLAIDGRSLQKVITGPSGMYAFRDVPTGTITVTSELIGFGTATRSFWFDQRARRLDFRMQVAALVETITVSSESTEQSARQNAESAGADSVHQAPSQNIINMQRRVAGVLPVRMDVPRTGNAYQFFKPLVLDEETRVAFRYRRR